MCIRDRTSTVCIPAAPGRWAAPPPRTNACRRCWPIRINGARKTHNKLSEVPEMAHQYKPRGVCSRRIAFDLTDGVVRNVSFEGGCSGNTQEMCIRDSPEAIPPGKCRPWTCTRRPAGRKSRGKTSGRAACGAASPDPAAGHTATQGPAAPSGRPCPSRIPAPATRRRCV